MPTSEDPVHVGRSAELVIIDDPHPPMPRRPFSASAMAAVLAVTAGGEVAPIDHAPLKPHAPPAPPEPVALPRYMTRHPDIPGTWPDSHWPNYQCAVRPHVTYRKIDAKARVTFKPNNGAHRHSIKHGAANTHPGKRGKRTRYAHVGR